MVKQLLGHRRQLLRGAVCWLPLARLCLEAQTWRTDAASAI